jgi:hypothetical protein
MSRNGSGVYSLPAGNPVVTGTTISSTWANGTLSDMATALTGSIAADGQTTASGNLPMGGFIHTNVGNATVRTNYTSAAQVQDGTLTYLTSVAGTNTITAVAAVGMTAYATGQKFTFVSAGANTGAATININSIGAKSLTKNGTTALSAGDIPSGAAVEVVYDGTQFQVVSSMPVVAPTSGDVVGPASATDNALARFNLTTGKLIQNSGVIVDDTNNVTGVATLTATTTIGVGAATPSASGAGITFPATQSASTDANTLDDYEEGTWTPTQGSGLTVVGTFSSSGTYTKVGRLCTVMGRINATTSLSFSSGNALICEGLPFTTINPSDQSPQGGIANAAGTAFTQISQYGAGIYSQGSLAATSSAYFSITYMTA